MMVLCAVLPTVIAFNFENGMPTEYTRVTETLTVLPMVLDAVHTVVTVEVAAGVTAR